MTTFQALIDAFIQSFTHLLPISNQGPNLLIENILGWPPALPEITCLVSLVGALCFLFFFRFDWLGMISALIKSIANPLSLKPESRNLDQHILIFLSLIFFPSFLLNHFTSEHLKENEFFTHPLMLAGLTAVLAYFFQFSQSWNKRIFGLNHLKLSHGFLIGLFALLRVHPSFPMIGVLWIGFAICNYHYEAVFKYSMLVLGINLVTESIGLLKEYGLKESLSTVGHLNSVAIIVVSFCVFWIGLENLQKNLSEATYRSFKWISGIFSLAYIGLYFFKS